MVFTFWSPFDKGEYMESPVILIVEKDPLIQNLWKIQLGEYKVIQALSIPEAEEKFLLHRNEITMVIMTARLGSKKINTVSLTEHIRKNFDGFMIATSSRESYRQMLVRAGCDRECERFDIIKVTKEVLLRKEALTS